MARRLLTLAGAATALLASACAHHSRPVAANTVPPFSAPPTASGSATASATPSASSSPSSRPRDTTTPSAAPAGPSTCPTSALSASLQMGQAGVGHVGAVLVLRNVSSSACTLYGYEGLALLDAAGHPMPTRVTRGQGYLYQDPGPHLVTLAAGATASSGVEWDHIPGPNDPQTGCATSTFVEVTPPNDYSHLTVRYAIQACNGGAIEVTAMQAGSAGPA